MDNIFSLTLDDEERLALISKALSSEVRIKILKLLCAYKLSVIEIAERVGIPASSAAVNVKVLEEAGLIATEVQNGVRGAAKLCYKTASALTVELQTESSDDEIETISMPIGNFVDYRVEPTCGMVGVKAPIGEHDEPKVFYDPNRTQAKLIWLGRGYLEYRFPNHMIQDRAIKGIEISAEICSEDHEYNNDYISDISLWVNGINAGTWECPGDFGGRRGKLNPAWWPDKNTQFGKLKTWKITESGTYLDKKKISDTKLSDFALVDGDYISVRIGNDENAVYQGGMNLFGDCFGDYPQDILMKIIYK